MALPSGAMQLPSASVIFTPRRNFIEEGWSMDLPSGAMLLPSARVTGTSGTPRFSF